VGGLLYPQTARNLVITGYTERNKVRYARRVANELGRQIIDVDQLIQERAGDDVQTIREQYGERRLRTLEDEVMENLVLYRSAVIRISAPTLLVGERCATLLENSYIIALTARLDSLLQGLHVLMGARYHNPDERAYALNDLQRDWALRDLKDIVQLDVTDASDDEITQMMLEIWSDIAVERA